MGRDLISCWSVEEQYRRAVLEVDVLQDHLALRRQIARQAQELKKELREKLQELEGDLQGERDDKQAIYSEMTRQHRSLEQESSAHIRSLEEEVTELKIKLAYSQNALQKLQEESERKAAEKEAEIMDLRAQMENMEKEYETLLHACLDKLIDKLNMAEFGWKKQALSIHQQYKGMLQNCGLNPLDI
ncbi:coiled-coil domain-containing protein 153 isoform X2 [Spea bombifrons]|uniref:coiled-coil domain-containing protein 153 isoform X2 n=1 Tax=Spea bombifrons TaxID=233779 RepID=UPI00234969B8|nr:coiled-coil domain-containing protein 153 isoform X2 [Spea bombifrons]